MKFFKKIITSIYNQFIDLYTVHDRLNHVEDKLHKIQKHLDDHIEQIQFLKNPSIKQSPHYPEIVPLPYYPPTPPNRCTSCYQDLSRVSTCMSTNCPYATKITCSDNCK